VQAETTKCVLNFQVAPPKGFGKLAGGILGATTVVGGIARLLPGFPSPLAVDSVDALFFALALGWVLRSVAHGCAGYFFSTPAVGAPRWRLMRVSVVNALFSVLWLSGAILLLQHPDPLRTLAATGLVSALVFVLSLWTLAASREARRPRGSEWIRARFREPLEPGGNTPIGWLLITLIDWRSAPSRLSTFVAGTLGLVAICFVAMAPAALHLSGAGRQSVEAKIGGTVAPAPGSVRRGSGACDRKERRSHLG
jgi:hypothetical protein